MPIDGSGNFTRSYNYVSDRNSGIKIMAARLDGEFDNVAAAINQMFLRTGVAPMTGSLNMNNNAIYGLNDGLVGTPAIRWSSDGTTGIYAPATGRVAISAGGVNRFDVGSSAISATVPTTISSTLNVTGATTLSSTLNATGNTTLGAALNVTGATTLSSTLNVGGSSTFAAASATSLSVSGTSTLGALNAGATSISSTLGVSGATTLAGLTATALTVNGNGSVTGTFGVTGAVTLSSTLGVSGTTSLATLNASGNANVSGTIYVGASLHGNVASDTNTLYMRGTNLALQNQSGAATYLYINSSGSVGVNTTTPASRFAVNGGAGGTDTRITVGNAATAVQIGVDSSNNGIITNNTANSLVLATNSTDRIRIDSAGNVGIGNIAPGYRLDIASADTTAGIGYAQRLRANATANAAAIQFTDSTGATQRGMLSVGSTQVTLQADSTLSLVFRAGAADRLVIDTNGDATSSNRPFAVGVKGIRWNTQSGAYTLALSDIGGGVYATGAAAAITVPAESTTNFPSGSPVVILNDGSGAKTITRAAGVAMIWTANGADGNRTLAVGGMCTVFKTPTGDRWYISGSGLS